MAVWDLQASGDASPERRRDRGLVDNGRFGEGLREQVVEDGGVGEHVMSVTASRVMNRT